MSRFVLALCCLIVTACAPRGSLVMAPPGGPVGTVQSVFIGTTRGQDPDTDAYSSQRQAETRFGRVDVSIPPGHQVGAEISWPRRGLAPNPQRDFLATGVTQYAAAADFSASLAKDLAQSAKGGREAVIYVHGFNNTFAEGVFRIAQLSHDLQIPGSAVHYSWPSRASALGYAYDRDSALFARDGLETLLQQVTAAGADRVLLVAHSMGAGLAMETLRQIALRGDRKLLSKVAGVMLMSPDIDVDVFRAQAQVIGRLPQPFLVFTSRRDSALALSAFVARESQRLGNLRDVSRLAGLSVTLVETGDFKAGNSHFSAATSPALIRLLASVGAIDAALVQDSSNRVGLLPGALLTIQGATRIVLDPFATLGEQISQ